jgi:hypothetical protein
MNNWNVFVEQAETSSFENRLPKITLKTENIENMVLLKSLLKNF